MVYIKTTLEGGNIILDCHKNAPDGEYFRLVIDAGTKEVIQKPENADINVSIAYSFIWDCLNNHKSIPKEAVAAWG